VRVLGAEDPAERLRSQRTTITMLNTSDSRAIADTADTTPIQADVWHDDGPGHGSPGVLRRSRGGRSAAPGGGPAGVGSALLKGRKGDGGWPGLSLRRERHYREMQAAQHTRAGSGKARDRLRGVRRTLTATHPARARIGEAPQLGSELPFGEEEKC
jgi:hypothetical protein